jgi:hypothetical protein
MYACISKVARETIYPNSRAGITAHFLNTRMDTAIQTAVAFAAALIEHHKKYE